MKRLIVVIISVMLTGSFITCKKAKGPVNGKSIQPNNNLDSTVSFSATINGSDWKTDSAYGYKEKNSANDSTISNLLINATDKSSAVPTTISFHITGYTGPAEYPINPPLVTATYYVGSTRYFGTQGMIAITGNSDYALTGTFYFKADTINVTDGVFNVALP